MDIESDAPEQAEDLYIGQDPDFSFTDLTPTHHDTLFLIDSSASMLETNESGEVPLFLALEAAAGYLKDKVVSDTKDSTGVILFNSAVTDNHMNFAGLRILRHLLPADVQGIKELQEFATRQKGEFKPGESLLVEALWLAHDVFTRAKATGSADRSLYLLTDEDNPNSASPGDQRRAIQRGKDLSEQAIPIDLFPFNKRNRKFDYKVLYQHIIDVEDAGEYGGFEKLSELKQAFRRKEYRKRTLATVPFMVTPNVTVKVRVYLLTKHSTKPTPVKIHAKTNKRLKTITKFICASTGKELWDHELGTFMEFGKEKVKLSKEDAQRVKTFGHPGLQLMGFKDKGKLKEYLNLKPAYFLHADDKSMQGSGQLMHALICSMIRKGKIAVARLLPRVQSIARFVALVPSADPQGLFSIFLPYADDIRSPESVLGSLSTELPPEKLVESASAMIRDLHIVELDLNQYPNPALQHFYSTLESLALEQREQPEVQDALLPDAEGFAKKAPSIQEFFFQVLEDRPAKRQRESTSPAPIKVVKTETSRGSRGRRK